MLSYRTTAAIVAVALCLVLSARAGDQQTGDLRISFPIDDATVPMRVYIPTGYLKAKALPAVIALHGAGVNEDSFFRYYDRGAVIRQAEAYQIIFASPRRPVTTLAEEARYLKAALKELDSRYRLDHSRLYLLGHSAGGTVAIHLAALTNHSFASVGSLAGGGFSFASPEVYRKIKVPVFLAAATGDEIVPIEHMRRAQRLLRSSGVELTYYEFEGGGHNTFVAPVSQRLFEWFLEHKRSTSPTPGRMKSIRVTPFEKHLDRSR